MQGRLQIESSHISVEPAETDYEAIIDSLFAIRQHVHKKPQHANDLLCQHLLKVSQGNIYLHITRTSYPAPPPVFTRSLHLPVHFGELIYGTLYIVIESGKAPISTEAACRIVESCGELLYICETRVLLQKVCQLLGSHLSGELSPREQDVLSLLCESKTGNEIANLLSIAPRTVDKHKQHIYDKLGVHNELAVPLAAYINGLFFPLDKSDE